MATPIAMATAATPSSFVTPTSSRLPLFMRLTSTTAGVGAAASRMRCVTAQDSARNNGVPISHSHTKVAAVEEGYIGLFVRMLGLDKPVEEREEAVNALWRHSEGGKENIDEIIKFPLCLNLVVSLIPSERQDSSEAAAGLLRQVAAIEAYRSLVAEAGAIEEIIGLLTRKLASVEVVEQAVCTLWNLSAEEKFRPKIASQELLPFLVEMLDSEEQAVQTAVAGLVSNLALSSNLHGLLMEAGIISKFANLLKADLQKVSKVARQEARSALLELSQNYDAKAAIIEEGLMFVPIIGADAYKSLKPHMDPPAEVPDNVKLDHPLGSQESAFGAGDVLLGLKVGDSELDKATQLAMEGRSKLRFLSRVGLLGKEAKGKQDEMKHTIMPWWDAIPRLVLILGLENVSYAKLGAEAIAEVAVNEETRQALAKAGAIPHLLYLLGSGDESATEAAALAIDKLSVSHKVRGAMNPFATIEALVAVLKADNIPESLQDKVLGALLRLSQTREEVKAMVQSGSLRGIIDLANSSESTYEARLEAENVIKEISSLKTDPRDKIASGIPVLIKCLSEGSLSSREKVALVLENMATKETHAIAISEAGVGAGLSSTFQVKLDEEESSIWTVVCCATRLLGKLLNFKASRDQLDCSAYVRQLSNILKQDATPLYVRDWVSACLLKLARYAKLVDVPVNMEVTLHDTIPRLLENMKLLDPDAQEAATLKLRDVLSSGVPEYVAAVAETMGGIFTVVETLRNGTPSARAAALSILHSLGTNDENHPAMVAAGAVPLLERVVRSEAGQWKLALDLLRLLPL